jgi:hypothetical protein
MINKINTTPFTINRTYYSDCNGIKYDLLIDTNVNHKFSELDKRTRYQDAVLK